MKTFISNPRKTLNSDWLNREIQRAHIHDRVVHGHSMGPIVLKLQLERNIDIILEELETSPYVLSSAFTVHNSFTR